MGASAGRVLLIPKGDWNADTTYTGLDWVRHNGAAWVCKNTCTDIEPTEANSDNWQIMSRDGTNITVDTEISDQSENPVQNKVIKKYVDDHSADVADMTGATSTQNGAHGLVPAPQIGDEKKALLGDGTWGSVDAILAFKTKEEYDAAVANDEIPDGSKVIKEYDDGDSTTIIDVDTVMSDTSTNTVQNKVIKKYVDEKQVNIDGVTLTLDEARNVIKLADTLKDKIGSALQPESIVNNQTTTEEGFALDARQANPNIDGSLANQISQLNTDSIDYYNCNRIYSLDSTGNIIPSKLTTRLAISASCWGTTKYLKIKILVINGNIFRPIFSYRLLQDYNGGSRVGILTVSKSYNYARYTDFYNNGSLEIKAGYTSDSYIEVYFKVPSYGVAFVDIDHSNSYGSQYDWEENIKNGNMSISLVDSVGAFTGGEYTLSDGI